MLRERNKSYLVLCWGCVCATSVGVCVAGREWKNDGPKGKVRACESNNVLCIECDATAVPLRSFPLQDGYMDANKMMIMKSAVFVIIYSRRMCTMYDTVTGA